MAQQDGNTPQRRTSASHSSAAGERPQGKRFASGNVSPSSYTSSRGPAAKQSASGASTGQVGVGAHRAPAGARTSQAARRTSSTADRAGARPTGTRFATGSQHAGNTRSHARAAGGGRVGVQSAYTRQSKQANKKAPVIPMLIALVVIVAVFAVIIFAVIPAVSNMFQGSDEPAVEAGIEVQVNIPAGASGDQIASILSQNHIIDDPQDYYAAVRELQADTQLKPGDYILTTGMDPLDVVRQLISGPNVDAISLTIQEGLTVDQTAARVEETLGIPASDFLAQAKASNYVADYPFLEGAYNDSLEGFLYPKTYSFTNEPTADEVIRVMLDQFEIETEGLNLTEGANGLTLQQLVSLASLVERETAVADERPQVASVIYNRLDANMPLQIDAAIVYARGGGSGTVTYDDLEIDSPYNVYQNTGLTPGPICSPSISSIEAAVSPADTNYLYYVLSPDNDGTHRFSETYDEFLANREEYVESRS